MTSLQSRCMAPISSFSKEGDLRSGAKGSHIFVDNGADILVTAHLDTVATHYQCQYFYHCNGVVQSRALDDRLGAWIALDILPKWGIKADVLLTEGEERGQSTASDFVPPRTYNWVACFDREGCDAVTYSYGNDEAEDGLKDAGFRIGWGSYTDICELDWMGIWGVNIGTGYYAHHTPDAWADLADTKCCLKQFCEFYKRFRDVELESTEKAQWWDDELLKEHLRERYPEYYELEEEQGNRFSP